MKLLTWLFLLSTTFAQAVPTTQRLYLSGTGPSDAVEWDFQVSAGRRAGEKAKIPVPSQWEQHGFGDYDYGTVPVAEKHQEDGLYHHRFTVPADWNGKLVRIVFEGAMTDTTVKINGRQAGPTHQGGFYRFEFDITDKVRFGKSNELEVLVSKDSANASVEEAERHADYWVFGGIFRPVWIEALPQQFIDGSSTDAKADGFFRATVYLGGNGDADQLVGRVTTLDGKPIGEPFSTPVSSTGSVELSAKIPAVKPWSAESPQLYQIEFSLMKGDAVIHRTTDRIGFRTLEIRPGKGVFVNGSRITVKGMNRHSFRPETGRSLDPQQCYEDVRLIQEMNMNAVRSSHYPPDKAFLNACDELGLYVIDELCTWQKPALDTATATRLIRQIVRRDANHPSILWWANGNEGGWNTAVDGEFPRWDLQQRPVLHPWDPFSGFQTKHYPSWDQLNQLLAGDLLVMPTEFLHGLFDGGHGAGLQDFWDAITSRPNGVGGFLWVLADEGIARSDRNGEIDTWGINAPDGIVGPHHEKEASFFTIKDIFCPVQIALEKLPPAFDGKIEVTNRYDFRDLSSVRFEWSLTDPPATGSAGEKLSPVSAAPGETAPLTIPLPADWKDHTALQLTATDSDGRHLWTWSWAIHPAALPEIGKATSTPPVVSVENGTILATTSNGPSFAFDAASGLILKVSLDGKSIPLANGPRFVSGIPATDLPADATAKVTHRMEGNNLVINVTGAGHLENFRWTLHPDGDLTLEYQYHLNQAAPFHGITFDLPEKDIRTFTWLGQGPRRVWRNRMKGTHFGRFEIPFKALRPTHDFDYPHARGYFAGIHQADIQTTAGTVEILPGQDDTFLRLGTNDEGEKIRTFWPDGDLSILHGIPAIGTKFKSPDQLGPQSQFNPAPGTVTGRATFRFRK